MKVEDGKRKVALVPHLELVCLLSESEHLFCVSLSFASTTKVVHILHPLGANDSEDF